MKHADIALLQEALTPHLRQQRGIPEGHWNSHCWNSDSYKPYWPRLTDRWPAVVGLSDRVEVDYFIQVGPISKPRCDQFAVSGIGTVAAARVRPKDDTEPFIVVSMYARWREPHPSAETTLRSAMRTVPRIGSSRISRSSLARSIPPSHRIIAAGDLNTIYGSKAPPNWTEVRDDGIWCRMHGLGLGFLGPQAPDRRQAEPIPEFMPCDTKNVVTYYTRAPGERGKPQPFSAPERTPKGAVAGRGSRGRRGLSGSWWNRPWPTQWDPSRTVLCA